MLLKNATVLNHSFALEKTDLYIKNGRFAPLSEAGPGEEQLDLAGCLIAPGLVDIHIHGFMGINVMNAPETALDDMSLKLAQRGITSFVPTLAAAPPSDTLKAIERICRLARRNPSGATIRGIYLEGPFVSPEKGGALRRECLRGPDIGLLDDYEACAGGLLKIVAAAPELPGAQALIHACAARGLTASIAHTTASYEQAMAAVSWGASHVTHLFNAMPPCLHRAPGVVGAAGDSHVTAELICDGFHIHPAVLRGAYKWLGGDRLILVSDSVMMAGLPDGTYVMDGTKSVIRGGVSRLEDGTINGGTHDLLFCVRQAASFGIPLEAALKMATIQPAARIGADAETGSIANGKRADCLVLDAAGTLKAVFVGGRRIPLSNGNTDLSY